MVDNVELFRSAEDAWCWYCKMQVERWKGMRVAGTGKNRPCDIDDIARIFGELCRDAKISEWQAYVMAEYGAIKQRLPDRRYEPRELQAWVQGMDILHTPLAQKGLIDLTNSHGPGKSKIANTAIAPGG